MNNILINDDAKMIPTIPSKKSIYVCEYLYTEIYSYQISANNKVPIHDLTLSEDLKK
jgi:hypothetical protein